MRIEWNLLFGAFAFFIGLIILLSYSKPRLLQRRFFSLFRVLFPSWRFFEDVGPVSRLYYRYQLSNGKLSDWMETPKFPQKKWHNLFFNPEGNLFLASHSLIDQAISDVNERSPNDKSDFSETVSYRLLRNLVEVDMIQSGLDPNQVPFQFKIEVWQSKSDRYEALISEEIEA